MAVCVKIKGKKRQICAGDLDRLITLENRAIQPPESGSVDYTELFSPKDTSGGEQPSPDGEIWAMIETAHGSTVFDGTSPERVIDHKINIRYIEGVTSETWVLADGVRFDIVSVEDLDFRHEWLRLNCTLRGTDQNSNNAI